MIALQIDAVTPNVFIQECFDDFLEPWVSDVLSGFVRVRDGQLEIPDAPGFGVTLNEVEARKHPYGKSNFLRMFRPDWERRDVAGRE
jgi:galactonate dehydratase